MFKGTSLAILVGMRQYFGYTLSAFASLFFSSSPFQVWKEGIDIPLIHTTYTPRTGMQLESFSYLFIFIL